MDTLKEIYPDRDNEVSFKVVSYDESGVKSNVDLSGVSRVILIVENGYNGSNATLDSNTIGSSFFAVTSDGDLTLYPQGVTLDDGEYRCKLIIYDALHTNGQYLAHPDTRSRLTVRVKNDS